MKEVTNSDRADSALTAVEAFADETGLTRAGEELPTIVHDLLTNLMHLCDETDLSFDTLLESARVTYGVEKREDP